MSAEAIARFFRKPADFRRWLETHHARAEELWVGFHRVDSGKASITWPESVDEALCFGWIDGLRKGIDGTSYRIRFTPRRPGSTWSSVNIRRAEALIANGRMQPAGRRAFEARREHRSGIYSYEQRPAEMPVAYRRILMKRKTAWRFFQAQSPSYRKTVVWWIVSAKKEETRLRRLEQLAELAAQGQRLPGLTPRKTARPKER